MDLESRREQLTAANEANEEPCQPADARQAATAFANQLKDQRLPGG